MTDFITMLPQELINNIAENLTSIEMVYLATSNKQANMSLTRLLESKRIFKETEWINMFTSGLPDSDF